MILGEKLSVSLCSTKMMKESYEFKLPVDDDDDDLVKDVKEETQEKGDAQEIKDVNPKFKSSFTLRTE